MVLGFHYSRPLCFSEGWALNLSTLALSLREETDSRGTEERRGFIWNDLESKFLLTAACGIFIFIGKEIMLSNCHCLPEKCCIPLKVHIVSKLTVSQTWHVTAEIIWDAPVKGIEEQIPRSCGRFLYVKLSLSTKGIFQKHSKSVLPALRELILHSLDNPNSPSLHLIQFGCNYRRK